MNRTLQTRTIQRMGQTLVLAVTLLALLAGSALAKGPSRRALLGKGGGWSGPRIAVLDKSGMRVVMDRVTLAFSEQKPGEAAVLFKDNDDKPQGFDTMTFVHSGRTLRFASKKAPATNFRLENVRIKDGKLLADWVYESRTMPEGSRLTIELRDRAPGQR